MPYVRYNHTHERERERPLYDDSLFNRTLVRQNSKRQRLDMYDDDEFDDYPYNNIPNTTSRALTIRAPNQIEKYNIWSPSKHAHNDSHRRYDSDNDYEDLHEHNHRHRYKYTSHKYRSSSPARDSDDDDERNREREFRLKVKATFSRPSLSRSNSSKMMHWPGELFRTKEKWVGVDWQRKERSRVMGDDFWDEPRFEEKTEQFRRIKRTKTDEWRPLKGSRW
ncbi:hypothetical protein BU24DRAFT_35027 [Aaosphaeria arxii CBS 175.79]|uniref:Uncharacterized protein n=1 Tax=Aaosphaeria arxii CBS 175.79 TaxID=1450172 RepID=A0A6A5Y9U6_9PLEO|nr:uncharacterized protein BU24DRAFT_35027 [Aaosphaeria arxii CBS 175.79]KAF2021993.1 hypothetical protein BU24DRAFT_35027 [Aaosphaeria arxii CBS 175.79]